MSSLSDIDAAHAILGLMRQHGAEGTGRVGNVAFGRTVHRHPNPMFDMRKVRPAGEPIRKAPKVGVNVDDFINGGLP